MLYFSQNWKHCVPALARNKSFRKFGNVNYFPFLDRQNSGLFENFWPPHCVLLTIKSNKTRFYRLSPSLMSVNSVVCVTSVQIFTTHLVSLPLLQTLTLSEYRRTGDRQLAEDAAESSSQLGFSTGVSSSIEDGPVTVQATRGCGCAWMMCRDRGSGAGTSTGRLEKSSSLGVEKIHAQQAVDIL